jgi:glycine/D-amino acid oxidase-like deaminating enzyme
VSQFHESAPGLDLRSGRSIWEQDAGPPTFGQPLSNHTRADIVIVGAGITGAFLAERLSRSGRSIVVLDRHEPQRASTAASTALLQWELDAPMLELEQRLGFDRAAAIYLRSLRAVGEIGALVRQYALDCRFAERRSLYLAGNALDLSDLREEHRLRSRGGIDGRILDAAMLHTEFGLDRSGALLSKGAAQVHPIDLASGLMQVAIVRGTRIAFPVEVVAYEASAREGITVVTSDGLQVHGEILILANGYEMPAFVLASRHTMHSTWAIATKPQPPGVPWPRGALIWEASEPYLYLRTTHEGHIVVGGEDEDLTDAKKRDGLTTEKAATLQEKLSRLVPAASLSVAAAWSGFFGETDDGLPLIGRVPGLPGCLAAFGYGGNGITFSAIAAVMLERLIAGDRDPFEETFALDR